MIVGLNMRQVGVSAEFGQKGLMALVRKFNTSWEGTAVDICLIFV